MDLFEKVSEDIKTAMKAKDKVALETLRNVKKVFLEAKTAPDALLVAKKGESQKVKNIVNQLKQNKRKEAKENVTMYRSWGKYTLLTESEGYRSTWSSSRR